ncbi:unnamed protein product [Ectocarpus fasciculatus]
MQRAPASGSPAGLVAALEPTAAERLDHVGKLLAEKKPWPAFLRVRARATEEWETCPTPVQEALAWMATATAVGVLDIASVEPLVPVCQAFKELIEAAEGAAESQDKLQRLVSRCAFLATVLIQHDRAVGPLAQVQKPMQDFVVTTNNLAAFAAKWAKGGKCRAIFCHRSDLKTLADFEEGLRSITNDITLVDGLEHHQLLLTVHRHLHPPTLPDMAAVPRGAISLTDAHVSRPSLLESAIGYLTNMARGDAPCVLTGMAGGGKSVLASAVVRDERVREHFSAGMFWWRVGRDAKDQLHEWLEGLFSRVASSLGTTPPMLDSVEEVTRYLKAVCADSVSPRLVVLDDVWEREVVDTLQLTGLQLLVTTRDRSVVSMPGECVEVGDMQENEALEVLRVGCGAPKNFELPRPQALQGKYTEAQPLVERALAIKEGALGVDHPSTITSRSWIADLYMKQGLLDKASPLLEEVVCSFERALGPDHPRFAGALNNWALLLSTQGRYTEAQPLFEQALAIREGALGVDHSCTIVSRACIADLYAKQGLLDKAAPLLEEVVCSFERALGPDHPRVGAALNNRAALLSTQGRYMEAQPLFERALAIREGALGVDHPDTIASRACIADLYAKQGLLDKASPLLEGVVCSFERALGLDHPSVAAALNNRAGLLSRQGKYDEVEPLYERSQAILEKALGSEHPRLAMTLTSRAELLSTQERYAEAVPLLERALSIFAKKLGGNNSATVTAQNNLEAARKRLAHAWGGLVGKPHARPIARISDTTENTLFYANRRCEDEVEEGGCESSHCRHDGQDTGNAPMGELRQA